MAFSIRLTDEEKALAESYARLHSMSVGAVKNDSLSVCPHGGRFSIACIWSPFSRTAPDGKTVRSPLSWIAAVFFRGFALPAFDYLRACMVLSNSDTISRTG